MVSSEAVEGAKRALQVEAAAVIALTGRPASRLGKATTVVVDMAVEHEAVGAPSSAS